MVKHNLKTFCNFLTLILTILFFISSTQPTSAAKPPPAAYTNFVKTKCKKTTYPTLCAKTLCPYAPYVKTNTVRLCNTALNVAIQGARNASTVVAKLKWQKGISRFEAAALKDCISDVKDAIYQLKITLNAMGHLGNADREYEWDNAKTWASAAISDVESCMDGFAGRKVNAAVKNKIRSCISEEEKLISIALALINDLY